MEKDFLAGFEKAAVLGQQISLPPAYTTGADYVANVAHLHADSEDCAAGASRWAACRRWEETERRAAGRGTRHARQRMPGPLTGVRVSSLQRSLGPWACQILGDLGADAVKVEPPSGDSNRNVGPRKSPDMGALFLNCNRNKRSVVLDLGIRPDVTPRCGWRRARTCSCTTTARRRLRDWGWSTKRCARSLNRLLRHVRLRTPGPTATGRPRRLHPGRGGPALLQAGALGVPRYIPTILADKTTALSVVSAVCAALFHRERTGEGQEIEVPMFETLVSFVMAEHLWARPWTAEGRSATRGC